MKIRNMNDVTQARTDRARQERISAMEAARSKVIYEQVLEVCRNCLQTMAEDNNNSYMLIINSNNEYVFGTLDELSLDWELAFQPIKIPEPIDGSRDQKEAPEIWAYFPDALGETQIPATHLRLKNDYLIYQITVPDDDKTIPLGVLAFSEVDTDQELKE